MATKKVTRKKPAKGKTVTKKLGTKKIAKKATVKKTIAKPTAYKLTNKFRTCLIKIKKSKELTFSSIQKNSKVSSTTVRRIMVDKTSEAISKTNYDKLQKFIEKMGEDSPVLKPLIRKA